MQTRRNAKTPTGRSKAAGKRGQAVHANELVDDGRTIQSTPAPGVGTPEPLQSLPNRQLEQGSTSRSKATTEAARLHEILVGPTTDLFLNAVGFSPQTLSALTPQQKKDLGDFFTPKQLRALLKLPAHTAPASEVSALLERLAEKKTSFSIGHPEAEAHGPTMVEQDDKVLVKDGVRYRPLPLVAQMAQAPRQTLLNWIKNKTEFAGRPLQSYYLAPVDRYFVSEESIQRIANRFIKWPSQERAGFITIGETKDKSGFLTMSAAARIIGISARTMWLWASQDKAPTSKPLDVVKCTTSDHFYIREKDVYELKKLVPKTGLQRGRRSQVAPHP